MRRINVVIGEELLQRCDELAQKLGVSRSELIRRVLREHLDQIEEKERLAKRSRHG